LGAQAADLHESVKAIIRQSAGETPATSVHRALNAIDNRSSDLAVLVVDDTGFAQHRLEQRAFIF
jgi:DICT domain-containing protein